MINVRMYDRAHNFLDIVANRTEPTFTETISDPGTGQFKLHTQDPILQRTPHLLDYGNIVLMHDLETGHYFAWRIEKKSRNLVSSAGGREELVWTISGRGAMCLMQAGIIFPEYGIHSSAQVDRPFNFATKASYWYDPAQWHTPHGRLWKNDTTSRRHYPKGWPDPDAQWIWSSDPFASADPGRCFFRGTFNLATAQRVAVFATADNSFDLYVDSELVMSGKSWKVKQRFDADLQAGDHIIGIRGTNAPLSGVNPAGVLCTVMTVDPNTEKTQNVIFHSNLADWLLHHVNTPYDRTDTSTWPPGWDAGDIIDQLMAEARTRGVQPIQRLTIGWTPSHDSAGVVWPSPVARSFSIGADYLEVCDQLAETAFDYRMVPSINSDGTLKLTLRLYQHLGVDRTIGSNNTSGVEVAYIPGFNVQDATFDGDASAIRTLLLIQNDDGWIVDTAGSIGTYERWESFLSAGQGTDQQALAVSQAAFAVGALPLESLSLKGQSMLHHKPFVDFDIGDTILAPKDVGIDKYRVLGLTLTEDTDGKVTWVPELGVVHRGRYHRAKKMIKAIHRGKAGGGTMGGVVASAMPIHLTPMDIVGQSGIGLSAASSGADTVIFNYAGSNLSPSLSGSYRAMFDQTLVEVTAICNVTDATTDLVLHIIFNGASIDTLTIPATQLSAQVDLNQYFSADSDILQIQLMSAGADFAELVVEARFS